MYGLNGSGKCPQGLTLEKARAEAMKEGSDEEMDPRHIHCVTGEGVGCSILLEPKEGDRRLVIYRSYRSTTTTTPVPGTAAGWVDSVTRFGSGSMGMAEVLAPAITLAEEGFPVRCVHGSVCLSREPNDRRRAFPLCTHTQAQTQTQLHTPLTILNHNSPVTAFPSCIRTHTRKLRHALITSPA